MPSTKSDKTANLPFESKIMKSFAKDWGKLKAGGKTNLTRAKSVMLLIIARDGMLPPEYLDHASKQRPEFRICHFGGDYVILYKPTDTTVEFHNIGSHSEVLFG